MKLDPTVMRTMSSQEFRVLEAVENGMVRDGGRALVPLPLVASIANLRNGGCHKIVSSLLRDKLLSHENKRHSKVDGYRLTTAGYDILALRYFKQRKFVAALGHKIGTGKESDIYLGVDPRGRQVVLKFHRLGRTSFRNVRQKRDYFNNSKVQHSSWLFLSRLSALKEYCFMKALYDVGRNDDGESNDGDASDANSDDAAVVGGTGTRSSTSSVFPTPTPLGQNRHVVVMSLVRGSPLYQVHPKSISQEQAQDLYSQSLELAYTLARYGLVHCDLNEFNLLVDLSGIQALANDDAEDPYVRHGGSVAVTEHQEQQSSVVGLLSKPAWEQSLEDEHEKLDAAVVGSQLPEPAARLPNGQPKPVLTLIDFPQMVSTSHPNARELFQRDVRCLRRFFRQKLKLNMDEADEEENEKELVARWDAIISCGDCSNDKATDNAVQTRLDTELRASGYSANDQQQQQQWLELYYFQSGPRPIASAIEEDEEGFDNSDGGGDDADDTSGGHNDVLTENSSVHDSDLVASNTIGRAEYGAREASSDDQLEDEEDEDTERNIAVSVEFDRSVDDLDSSSLLLPGSREELEAEAKARVRKQLEGQKRKGRMRNAFQKRNNNKNYIKGKRILAESAF